MSEDFIPVFTVELEPRLRQEIQGWPRGIHDEFVMLAYALGSADKTENLRRIGGTSDWLNHGNFHMTYVADVVRKVIRVTDGAHCMHESMPGVKPPYSCHQHPSSPHYRGDRPNSPAPEVAAHRHLYRNVR